MKSQLCFHMQKHLHLMGTVCGWGVFRPNEVMRKFGDFHFCLCISDKKTGVPHSEKYDSSGVFLKWCIFTRVGSLLVSLSKTLWRSGSLEADHGNNPSSGIIFMMNFSIYWFGWCEMKSMTEYVLNNEGKSNIHKDCLQGGKWCGWGGGGDRAGKSAEAWGLQEEGEVQAGAAFTTFSLQVPLHVQMSTCKPTCNSTCKSTF